LPSYTFECTSCERETTITCPIAEVDEDRHCEDCGTKLRHRVKPVGIVRRPGLASNMGERILPLAAHRMPPRPRSREGASHISGFTIHAPNARSAIAVEGPAHAVINDVAIVGPKAGIRLTNGATVDVSDVSYKASSGPSKPRKWRKGKRPKSDV
jgi:putative FmdB family regulatory protein